MSVPRSMRALFWETRPGVVDPERDADFILERVLEFGRLPDVRWAIRRYGLKRIHRFLATAGHPELSPRTLALWRGILHAERERWPRPPAFRRNSSAYWAA